MKSKLFVSSSLSVDLYLLCHDLSLAVVLTTELEAECELKHTNPMHRNIAFVYMLCHRCQRSLGVPQSLGGFR